MQIKGIKDNIQEIGESHGIIGISQISWKCCKVDQRVDSGFTFHIWHPIDMASL